MDSGYYIPRLFDKTLEFSLQSKGAVVIVGPKSCGKTTTAKKQAKAVIDLLNKSTLNQYVDLAKNAPNVFLNIGEKPLLIDEWQVISFIWNSVKEEIDLQRKFGLYILTGNVTDKTVSDDFDNTNEEKHTGTGRIVKKIMRTMSLYESNDSTGNVSLHDIENNIFTAKQSDKTINDYAYYLCRGGWPLAMNQNKKVALQQSIDFLDQTVSDDIFSLKDVPLLKDENKARKLMRSYSRNIGSQCSDNTIISDITSENETMNARTFEKYLLALNRLYVIDELEAWNPNLRSKTAIRTSNTRYFVDPSIATAALRINPESIFMDIKTFGFLFENMAIRDLKIYCEFLDAKLYHYRDSKNRKCDAVIQFNDGRWALIEVKLCDQEQIDLAAKKLIDLSKDINEEFKEPVFLMVITATNMAYRRSDGVYVVPLGMLKP